MHKISKFILLSFFSLLLFAPGISKVPALDRDEVHFAQASRQMLQTGNYFQIRFQDETRFQKPPGINWLQAVSVKLFSQADSTQIWPYRIPSLLGALLSVLLTYYFAARFINSRAALIGAALLGSSLLLVFEAHMAVIDAMLLFSVVLMQGSLWIIYQHGINKKTLSWGWALSFWLALSLGFVLKGVTPLFAVLSILTLCIVDKRVDWLRGLRLLPGLSLFIALNFAWLALVNEAEHSNYLLQMINRDLLPKLQGGHESHGKPPLFHLFILPFTFWPGSLFLWPAGVYAWKNRREDVVKFLLAWLLPSWIFFECMPTKLPQYVLPLFPAIALLCSLAIENHALVNRPGKWVRLLQISWGFLSVSIGFSIVLMSYWLIQNLNFASIYLFFAMIILTFLAIFYASRGLYQNTVKIIVIGAVITYSLFFNQLLPQLKPLWLTASVAQLVDKSLISKEKPLLVVGFDEPSLVFNLDTYLVKFMDITTATQQLTKDPSQIALFESGILHHWKNRPQELLILSELKGFDYSKGKWIKLILIGPKQHWSFKNDNI